ncbi:WYL domain-containing protein OS=Streptomyces aurantiogriseus OX=66870 GN=GCM10010251_36310 PE=4 SV=1 [Streptomyces aurantiogriseus]|uniref:WYL domain-containing protein n=1 Tax=Streptomyces aurantiogriseus TaxID=66870 RepID=A0A918CED3_9ACTN|nr:hypothetical protein GCM10010251_36310 [Streptomyces aurantiogriseus]
MTPRLPTSGELRRRVDERPGGIEVTVRVRRDRLDMFQLARLSYGVLGEARQLLAFSDRVEVLSPSEVGQELRAAAASVTELYQHAERGPE